MEGRRWPLVAVWMLGSLEPGSPDRARQDAPCDVPLIVRLARPTRDEHEVVGPAVRGRELGFPQLPHHTRRDLDRSPRPGRLELHAPALFLVELVRDCDGAAV